MPDMQLKGLKYIDYLRNVIEEEYGLGIEEVSALDGNTYLIAAGNESLLAEKTDSRESRILFLTGIYDHLKHTGFENIINIFKTLSGKYYIQCGEDIFIVVQNTDLKKNFNLRGNEEGIFKLLAKFHRAAAGYIPPTGGKAKSCWGRWIERQRKECRDIKNYRLLLKGKYQRSPFETMFLSSSDIYIDRMEKSINLIKREGYLDSVEESMRNHQICLFNFKQSNFYFDNQGICIKSLYKCRYDMVERDIADLLQKMAESGVKGIKQKAGNLLKGYHSENNLLDNSINIVKAFLFYPCEYEKICSKRARGKDKWTEGEYMEKLKKAMELDDRKAEIAGSIG